MIGCLVERVQAATVTECGSTGEIWTAVLAVVAALGGVFVGVFAPVFTSSATRRHRRRKVEREIANNILTLLEPEEDMGRLLSKNVGNARRRLLLYGNRLQDEAARDACNRLVGRADSSDGREDLTSFCAKVIKEVSRVYRENA